MQNQVFKRCGRVGLSFLPSQCTQLQKDTQTVILGRIKIFPQLATGLYLYWYLKKILDQTLFFLWDFRGRCTQIDSNTLGRIA